MLILTWSFRVSVDPVPSGLGPDLGYQCVLSRSVCVFSPVLSRSVRGSCLGPDPVLSRVSTAPAPDRLGAIPLPRTMLSQSRRKKLVSPPGPDSGSAQDLREALSALRSDRTEEEKRTHLAYIHHLVKEAWQLPGQGREVASAMCREIRLQGTLELLVEMMQSRGTDTRYEAGKLLEQVLITENRDRLARTELPAILQLAMEREDVTLAAIVSGVLQHMFKHSEVTTHLLITNGGLDFILFWCRSADVIVLRHCAAALANCAMHGGHNNQRLMVEKKAADWLFPLAFATDRMVRFHACLAVTVLATNKEVEKEVERSGTLELVEPFVASLQPDELVQSWLDSTEHSQGRTACELQRLVQLLDSSRLEAQCMAAFYLCVEAGVKAQQNKTQVLHEVGATQSLKRIVSYSGCGTVSALAKKALCLLGEEVPRRLSPTVPNWKPVEVQTWLQQVGFAEYCERFWDLQVDGDLLLLVSESELKEDLGIQSSITRRRFLRELRELKINANYSTCDPGNLADWLAGIDLYFRQYTYHLVHCGIGKETLSRVTEEQLRRDCGIENGVHRARIFAAGQGKMPDTHRDIDLQPNLPCDLVEAKDKAPDVFISYRRSTGSQLASLLKVHLQLRGFSVFIDVEKLEAGMFEDKLLQSVKRARNFVLVLTANALDKCMGDLELKDWVHKEIVIAMSYKKNIVPIIDQFCWPDPNLLPEDMRGILEFNGVQWVHEYQDASMEKILRFLLTQNGCPLPAGTDSERHA
ncbi:NAD(+) hydrolase SARM1 isoform X2 [Mobula hypostoma]|uniref:NAD(+) hydrolase SARM1 isoform X2 n=1 Tax=Mobula hypostoma TaxID=723540 RepID=UPI002FC29A4C